jgi:hypothetical protein
VTAPAALFVVLGHCIHDNGPFVAGRGTESRTEAVKTLWEAVEEHAQALEHKTDLGDQPRGHDPGGFFRVDCAECGDCWCLDVVNIARAEGNEVAK